MKILLHVMTGLSSKAAAAGILSDAARYLLEQSGFATLQVQREGKAAAVIPESARRQDCNLIVMGSHGYGSLGSLVLGSVTQGVLTSSHIPVLVFR